MSFLGDVSSSQTSNISPIATFLNKFSNCHDCPAQVRNRPPTWQRVGPSTVLQPEGTCNSEINTRSQLRAKWSTHQMRDWKRKTTVCGHPTYHSGCWAHLESELEIFIVILLWIWDEPGPKGAGFSVTGTRISQNNLEQLPRALPQHATAQAWATVPFGPRPAQLILGSRCPRPRNPFLKDGRGSSSLWKLAAVLRWFSLGRGSGNQNQGETYTFYLWFSVLFGFSWIHLIFNESLFFFF